MGNLTNHQFSAILDILEFEAPEITFHVQSVGQNIIIIIIIIDVDASTASSEIPPSAPG